KRFEGHTSSVFSVVFIRDGQQFLTGSSDGSVRLWDVESGKELRRFEGKSGGVFDVVPGPGEQWFLSSGSDGTLHVWDMETGRQLHRFDAETHCTGYLAVSPDGRFAASGFGAYPNPKGGPYLKDDEFAVHLWRLPKLPGTGSIPPAGVPGLQRAEIPDEAAQKQAEQQIREIFKQEYASAKQPAEQTELAMIMLGTAQPPTENADRYVLLREARNLATAAGDVQTALKSIDELGRIFEVNALQLKAETLETARREARSDDIARLVADSALSAVDEAIRAEEFDLGSELNSVARMAGRRIKDRELIDRVSTARDRIIDRRREFQEFEDASDKLSTSPDDEDASRIRGLYLCLRRNNWAEGLPLLQRSGHEEFEKIAELELMHPTEPADQLKLADAWWNRAESTRGSQQNALRSRALYWYERVLPELSGLQKTAVAKKISASRNQDSGP
ncbi:MAG: hypothetical protein KDA79_24035, partial [Planctomycetaceae bacterium]|nr:hypothetical protein [Planctomycetaceae bacterium]